MLAYLAGCGAGKHVLIRNLKPARHRISVCLNTTWDVSVNLPNVEIASSLPGFNSFYGAFNKICFHDDMFKEKYLLLPITYFLQVAVAPS